MTRLGARRAVVSAPPSPATPNEPDRQTFADYLAACTLDPWLVHVRARLYASRHGLRNAEAIAEAFLAAHPEMITEDTTVRPSHDAGQKAPRGLRRASVVVPDGPSPALARDLRTGLVKDPGVRTEGIAPDSEVSEAEVEAPTEVPRSEPGSAPGPPPRRRPFTGSVAIG